MTEEPATDGDGSASFLALGLHEKVARGAVYAGFTAPREIQSAGVPVALAGQDVLGLAHTGSGKTAAYGMPILDRFCRVKGAGPRALVIAPTRELAAQITWQLRRLGRYVKPRIITVHGGVPRRPQVLALKRKPHLVVACPGRALDLMESGALRLERLECLVLDEADHLLDLGFLPQVEQLLAEVPDQSQKFLFSATMPDGVRGLAERVLHQAAELEFTDQRPVDDVDHYLMPTRESRKRELLLTLLDEIEGQVLVFARTRHRVVRLAEWLAERCYRVRSLQGRMNQDRRWAVLRDFRQGRARVLVATDVAARGLDIEAVAEVINFDVPQSVDDYVHRLGRTGRAGRQGRARTMVTPGDRGWVRAVEDRLGSEIPRQKR